MAKQLSLCVIGDLALDVVTRLPELDMGAEHGPQGFNSPRHIDAQVGGTGVLVATSAAQQGFSPVSLIGKIGVQPANGQPDIAAQFILARLQQHGIQSLLATDAQEATAKVMITYLAGGRRLFIYDRGANASFNERDITPTSLAAVAQADILFVSGYSLLIPTQAEAVLQLMQEARAHQRLVALDVVPHKIYELIDTETFRAYTRFVDVLISETVTMQRFFPSLHSLDPSAECEAIAAYLTRLYPTVILYPSNTQQYIYDRSGLVELSSTGYTDDGFEQGLSFLDRMSLHALQRQYSRFIAASLAVPDSQSND